MKTKEAISYLNKLKKLVKEGEFVRLQDEQGYHNYYEQGVFKEHIDEVISLLQELEKYEEMWGKLRTDNYYHYREMQYFLDEIEQQYFPKEINNADNNR